MSETREGRIAVVIPCYESGLTLTESVASVLAQTRPAHEVLVVDDGSRGAPTLQALASLPASVQVLREPHRGVAGARDAGVRASRSEYLLWLDADDVLAPDFLEATARELDARPDVDVVATAFESFGAERYRWTPPDPLALERHFSDGTFLVTALFRRSLWDRRGGADPRLAVLEDWDYWLGALAAGHRAHVIDRALVRVRIRPASRRLRGLEGDRMAPALRLIVDKHRPTIVGLGRRLTDTKTAILAELQARRSGLVEDREARLSRLGPAAPPAPRALVLMYHRVADLDPDPFRLCVPPGLFARQLDALGRSFRVLSVTELLDRLAEDTLPPRAVALTFDDGYADARTAVDLLEALGMPATFFVNTEGLDAPRHESWEGLLEQLLLGTGRLPESFSLRRGETVIEAACATPEARRQLFDALHAHGYGLDAQGRADLVDQLRAWSGDAMTPRETHRVLNEGELRALARRPGVEIGVHGAAHIALPLHAPSVQEHELRSARERLEGVLGIPVTSLAYAYGAHDDRSVAIAARLGFRCAFSVSEAALLPWDDPLTLPRIDVGAGDPQVLVARLEALL